MSAPAIFMHGELTALQLGWGLSCCVDSCCFKQHNVGLIISGTGQQAAEQMPLFLRCQ